ncbi:small integral membrane protein 24 [Notolabrus celidotus]|uniref:small integral membrane protein 24 n=1 Tax=Notolabrus celidotus TaxID=1203425 RepID=UPI0014900D7F|nr:small integral membrane protein 24 [Notolabrus celidotus]
MNLFFPLLCVLLSASSSADKGVKNGIRVEAGSKSGTLQPWLVGLTAVVGFLFIVFTILIVHRLLRKNRKNGDGSGYEHKVLEVDDIENKQTSL